MKIAFYFAIKTMFALKYLNYCSDKEPKFNFKIYDVIYWEFKNYNTHITQRSKGNQTMKFGWLKD